MMHLLRKELSELFNKQMLMTLLVSFLLIMLFGFMMTSMASASVAESGEIHIIDLDQTDFTQQITDKLEEYGYIVEVSTDTGSYQEILTAKKWHNAAVLPEGMTDTLLVQHESCEIEEVDVLTTTSSISMAISSESSANLVSSAVSVLLSEQYLTGDLAFLELPVEVIAYTAANQQIVQADSYAIVSSLSVFDTLMPMIVFLLVVLTSQTIITAIATEKTDKTLETLLSAPVPRMHIILSKMLAALIVALTYALTYGLGFLIAMLMSVDRTTENIDVSSAFSELLKMQDAVQMLGLQISGLEWLGVIAQLLLTLGIALMASIILGALVEDAKSAQTVSLPILVCTMFPYLLSIVTDIRNMDMPARLLLLCIPFTHTFIATSCLRFHQSGLFWSGMVYQFLFFIILSAIALKLYQSDILFVHSFGKRKKQNSEKHPL